MLVAQSLKDLKQQLSRLRESGARVAFVPTMGNLHAGHLSLFEVARRHAPAVVASIYINPLQFGPDEDFNAYPRTPGEDRAALERAGADLLFMPGQAEIYPRGLEAQTTVEVPGLSDILCGAFRPGHFRGVTTVVNRLFNLVRPDVAIFGKKDYQQLLLIRLMVSDLGLPVRIIGAETVREADGLAMSSRNQYLSAEERKLAPQLFRTLSDLHDSLLAAGEYSPEMEKHAVDSLTGLGFRPEYVSIRRQEDLARPHAGDRDLVVLAAAWLGRTRLIDNMEIHLGNRG